MATAQTVLGWIENTVANAKADSGLDPCVMAWIGQLRSILDEELPELTHMAVNTVYRFRGKKGLECRAVCTKENAKTWVLYETVDSSRPGTRWMIGKGWCTAENIERDTYQSYELPADVKVK